MEVIMKALGALLLGVGLIVGLGLLMALPTMWLWDWLMPELFGLSEITVWQAWGINILSGFLFKSSTTINKN